MGLHLIQKPTEAAGNVTVPSSYDQVHGSRKSSEPQLNSSWIEDFQSTTRALETRLNTIEDSHQSSEMNRCVTIVTKIKLSWWVK